MLVRDVTCSQGAGTLRDVIAGEAKNAVQPAQFSAYDVAAGLHGETAGARGVQDDGLPGVHVGESPLRRQMMLNRLVIFGTLFVLALAPMDGEAQTAPRTSSRGGRAKTGEQMMVLTRFIKADKKQQAEDYLAKFHAALEKVGATDPIVKRVDAQTRVLFPNKANADGTYTYIFLMDPVVEGADYDMVKILKKAMPAAEADRLWQQFEDSAVQGKGDDFEVIQTR